MTKCSSQTRWPAVAAVLALSALLLLLGVPGAGPSAEARPAAGGRGRPGRPPSRLEPAESLPWGLPPRLGARATRAAGRRGAVPFVGLHPPVPGLEPVRARAESTTGRARRKCPLVSRRRRVAFRASDGEVITPHRIERFLRAYGSPMAPYARHIVRAGMRNDIDPRVIVAIAGVESSYGRHAPGFNAWGWGRARWGSWSHAIHGFSRSVSANYRSLRTGRFERAAGAYCGQRCRGRWDARARSIFSSI